MLKGIDISNWQLLMNLSTVIIDNRIDFVIAKATEGLCYVDRQCDVYIQSAIQNNSLLGYYHFARNNDPRKECEFFVDMTEGYVGKGIPILDIEDVSIANWGRYVDSFCVRHHELTGVWPMIYVSAGHLPKLANCVAYKNCALWVAGYPKKYAGFVDAKMPYPIAPWKTWTLWQFTSSGRLSGYGGDLDLDYANLDADGWMRIARGERGNPLAPSSDELTGALQTVADHVIAGEFGNGDERKQKVYDAVQEQVNLRVVY